MEFILTNNFGLELIALSARQVAMKTKLWGRATPTVGASIHNRRSRSSSIIKGSQRRCRATMERRQQQAQQPKKQQQALFEVSSLLDDDLLSSSPSSSKQTTPIWLIQHRSKKALSRQDSDSNSCDDEFTLETVNSYEEDEETSVSCSLSSNNSVSFAEPLVTEIWYRPIITTNKERLELFYTDADYKAFRVDFFEQRRRAAATSKQRVRKVKFQRSVVSATHVYAADTTVQKDVLFYSESDLQRFLDEFVASLNGI